MEGLYLVEYMPSTSLNMDPWPHGNECNFIKLVTSVQKNFDEIKGVRVCICVVYGEKRGSV